MSVVIIRPTAVITDPGASRVNPTPATPTRTTALWTNVQDGSDDKATPNDTTYDAVDETAWNFGRSLRLALADPTIPAGGVIKAVRISLRAKDISTGAWESQVAGYLTDAYGTWAGDATLSVYGTKVFTNYIGAWITKDWNGVAWTQATLNAMQVSLQGWTDNNGTGVQVSEVWVEIDVDTPPTVTVTGPVEGSTIIVSNPTATWDYDDAEGDAASQYRVKVFSSAQYGAGGFSPSTSAAFYDSGWISAAAPQLALAGLTNGTWRVYVMAKQTGNALTSAWDYNQFTVTLTPPPVPTLTAVYDAVKNRVALTFGQGGASPTTEYFEVQYSDDSGVTWTPHRSLEGFGNFMGATGGISGGPTWLVYDYEAPPNVTRQYRARAVHTVGSSSILSAFTATQSVTTVVTKWWVKDVSNPPGYLDGWQDAGPTTPVSPMILRFDEETFDHSSLEQSEVTYPLGRKYPVILSGAVQGETFQRKISFASDAEYRLFEKLRSTQRVLLLQSDMADFYWVKIVGARQVSLNRTTLARTPYLRSVTVSFIEQDEPTYQRAGG